MVFCPPLNTGGCVPDFEPKALASTAPEEMFDLLRLLASGQTQQVYFGGA